jgi:predicted transcriptional regulator
MEVTGTINEILKHKGAMAWSISAEATVFEALQLMAEKNVGSLLAMAGDKLVGVVSERDYTRKILPGNQSAGDPFHTDHFGHPGPHGRRLYEADDQ